MPTDPPKRQPSRPEIQGIAVDKLVGRATDLVGATTRKQTFTGLGALKPPPLPGELAPTLPVPNPLQHLTVRRPTPPSVVVLARRTPLPPSDDTPEPSSPATGQPDASLPPMSQTADDASNEALRRRAEAAEEGRAEAERKLRVQLEAKGPGPYQAPITPAPSQPQRRPSPAGGTESIRPDGTVESLRKSQTRLYVSLAALAAVIALPLAAWLQAAAEAKARSQSADVRASAANSTADSAKAAASNADKELVKLRDEFRLYRANMREVFRLQGIDMPKHPDDPDPNELKPVTPYCPRGKVCTGPQLVLQVAP